jgi:hypothetical protein
LVGPAPGSVDSVLKLIEFGATASAGAGTLRNSAVEGLDRFLRHEHDPGRSESDSSPSGVPFERDRFAMQSAEDGPVWTCRVAS